MNTAVATTNEPRWKVTLNTAMPSIREALPAHITEAKFRQVAAAAIGSTPMLKKCMEENPKAVLTALSQCASDGLLPDNRQAALVPFKSNGVMNLTYIPMIAGVLIRMRNSGEVESVTSRIVHANDHFEIEYGDDEKFTHKPPVDRDADRGEPIGAYAIIRLKGGEVYREFMSKAEIMKVKAASRAKGGPWSGSFETEMWRKTVLKRAAKYCPFSNEMADLMNRDNSFYDPERTIDATPKQTVADRFASQIAQESAEDVSPGEDMPEDENASPEPSDGEYEYIPDAEFTEPADDETEQPGETTSPSPAGAEEGGDPAPSTPPPSAPSTEDLPAKPLISKPIMAKADAIKKAKSGAEATQMFERFEQSDLGQQCTDQEFAFVRDARDWRVRQG